MTLPTRIKHVVVLMFENRSFDHMCGWFGRGDGLGPGTFNLEDPVTPGSPAVPATRDAAYVGDLTIEPGHALLDVNEQLFASVVEPDPPIATNSGFVWNYARQAGNTPAGARRVMRAFDPGSLPVLSTLAREFVLCDRWFASVPGPTWPNRFFTHAGTSGGFADNQFRDYQFQTIYHRLDRDNRDWAIYFHDFPHAYTLASLRTPKFAPHFRFAKQFFLDLKHGRLPAYSFIEPRYFDFLRWKANDLHPPHDVRLGEHLVADIYEALRKSSAWDSSLFIVLFDEHGGLYDHVPPPAAINPDGKDSISPPFRFHRLGPRVPAVVISPWVQQGVVDSTVFDHTSVIATVRELFDLGGPLTDRDGAAATLTHLLQGTARTGTPTALERPPEPTADAFHADGTKAAMTAEHVAADLAIGAASSAPLTEFQRSLVETAHSLQAFQPRRAGVVSRARLVDNEHEGAVYVRELAARLFER
jgi:phospholipase C